MSKLLITTIAFLFTQNVYTANLIEAKASAAVALTSFELAQTMESLTPPSKDPGSMDRTGCLFVGMALTHDETDAFMNAFYYCSKLPANEKTRKDAIEALDKYLQENP